MKRLLSAGAIALLFGSFATAQTSVALDFNGSGNSLAATGFGNVLNENTSGYNVAGGRLSITTLPGDMYGNFEGDPDVPNNLFSSNLSTTSGTTVDAFVRYSGLNANFHGGGIWMGLDTDHYIRLGAINAGSEIRIEAIRENETLWNNGSDHLGPGGEIVSGQSGVLGSTPQTGSLDVYLRLVRTGTSVVASYSLDGSTYTQVANSPFSGFQIASSAFTESSTLKVGAFAFGGPVGQTPATVAFDSFNAQAVPEPMTMVALGLGVAAMIRRRKA